MPKRIQRKRAKGWRMPPNTFYVGRPTIYGNPFRVAMYSGYTVEDAISDYRKWILRDPSVRSFDNAYGHPASIKQIKAELKGKDLACWCRDDQKCHADVLLVIANME